MTLAPGSLASDSTPRSVTVRALSTVGLETREVHVTACSMRGSGIDLPDAPPHLAREVIVRVRSALAQVGVRLDDHAVSIDVGGSLSAALDLPIAVAVLAVVGRVPAELLGRTGFLGELSLGAAMRPARGVLPALQGAAAGGVAEIVVPVANAAEAGLVSGLRVRAAADLEEVIAHLRGEVVLPTVSPTCQFRFPTLPVPFAPG